VPDLDRISRPIAEPIQAACRQTSTASTPSAAMKEPVTKRTAKAAGRWPWRPLSHRCSRITRPRSHHDASETSSSPRPPANCGRLARAHRIQCDRRSEPTGPADENRSGALAVRFGPEGSAPTVVTSDNALRQYKKLSRVEQAFHCLNGMDVLARPFRHRTDNHLRTHMLPRMLVYDVKWRMRKPGRRFCSWLIPASSFGRSCGFFGL